MRTGEIRNLLSKSINEASQIVINHEVVFGGQAYRIINYNHLIEALDILSKQPWNDASYEGISSIKANYPLSDSATITQDEYNQLNSYVSSVNQKLPVFIGIIDSLTQDQDEQVINVRLPGTIASLPELSELNNNLERIFKEFNVDGGVEFRGFDKGSDWYILYIVGVETYKVFIGGLKVAQEIYKARKAKTESDTAEIEYKAAIKQVDGKYKEEDLEKYITEKMDLMLEKKVREVLAKVENTNGFQKDLETRIIKATKDLVKVLGENVEFHLSLNPPEYATETSAGLVINYKKIAEINEAASQKPAQIEKPKESSEQV